MSAKENKALARRLYERWNKDKATALAVIDELCATDIVVHGGGGDEIHGIKDFKKSMGELFDAFPDLHITIDDMITEGDKVVVRYTWTGTHKGAFTGIPPTNKKFRIWEIDIIRVAGGKFVESWARMDTLGMMQQLGVIPAQKK
jgi:steroid delta-isomerase-like uncharacterized protein